MRLPPNKPHPFVFRHRLSQDGTLRPPHTYWRHCHPSRWSIQTRALLIDILFTWVVCGQWAIFSDTIFLSLSPWQWTNHRHTNTVWASLSISFYRCRRFHWNQLIASFPHRPSLGALELINPSTFSLLACQLASQCVLACIWPSGDLAHQTRAWLDDKPAFLFVVFFGGTFLPLAVYSKATLVQSSKFTTIAVKSMLINGLSRLFFTPSDDEIVHIALYGNSAQILSKSVQLQLWWIPLGSNEGVCSASLSASL